MTVTLPRTEIEMKHGEMVCKGVARGPIILAKVCAPLRCQATTTSASRVQLFLVPGRKLEQHCSNTGREVVFLITHKKEQKQVRTLQTKTLPSS